MSITNAAVAIVMLVVFGWIITTIVKTLREEDKENER